VFIARGMEFTVFAEPTWRMPDKTDCVIRTIGRAHARVDRAIGVGDRAQAVTSASAGRGR
jgi:hypothetical protein